MAVLRSNVMSRKSTAFLLASMMICKQLCLKILHISFLIASSCLGDFVQVASPSSLSIEKDSYLAILTSHCQLVMVSDPKLRVLTKDLSAPIQDKYQEKPFRVVSVPREEPGPFVIQRDGETPRCVSAGEIRKFNTPPP